VSRKISVLNVTEAARKYLAEKLVELHAPEGVAMRVLTDGPSLSLSLGPIQRGDQTISHDGKPILAIAQSVFEASHNRTLDVFTTIRGRQLRVTERTVRQPNLRVNSRSSASSG
jgi:hypothetical protein